jgi:Predicted membrane protein
MVSTLSLIFLITSELICFGFPIGLAVYLYKKDRISIKAVLAGALAFVISQPILRIPLLKYCSTQMWYIEFSTNKLLLSLFLGLTAGLFEETARFIGLKYLLKNKLEWKNGIAFGIGHGGIEAILIVGLSLINYIIYAILINMGKFDTFTAGKISQSAVYAIKNSMISAPSYMFLLGGLERIFAITAHIAFTMVVLYGVMNKKNIYLLYAILLHALLDAPIGLIKNSLLTEAYVFIFAVASFIFIIKSKNIPGYYPDKNN